MSFLLPSSVGGTLIKHFVLKKYLMSVEAPLI
jgi:hypothetical protein